MRKTSESTDTLQTLFAAAQAHGENSDDPEHEVGDLQGYLWSAWSRLTREQQLEVYEEHKEIVAEWLHGGA